jgi:hypothetical protein
LLLSLVGGVAAEAAKLRVVLIDGENNHNWRATTPMLKKILEDSGRFTVEVSTFLKAGEAPGTVPSVPFPPDLGKYDIVVSNYNNNKGSQWPKEFQTALEEALRAGRIGLVIVHAANNAFKDKWPEFDRMTALGWRDNKYGDRLYLDESGKPQRAAKGEGPGAGHGPQHAFVVTIRDSDHPITRGLPKEWMHAQDELYHGQRGPAENVHILATAFSAKEQRGTGVHEPMLLTIAYGKGRVFHTMMGHDLPALRCVGFGATLQRGTEWAATGTVTLPLPPDFPPPDATRSIK